MSNIDDQVPDDVDKESLGVPAVLDLEPVDEPLEVEGGAILGHGSQHEVQLLLHPQGDQAPQVLISTHVLLLLSLIHPLEVVEDGFALDDLAQVLKDRPESLYFGVKAGYQADQLPPQLEALLLLRLPYVYTQLEFQVSQLIQLVEVFFSLAQVLEEDEGGELPRLANDVGQVLQAQVQQGFVQVHLLW